MKTESFSDKGIRGRNEDAYLTMNCIGGKTDIVQYGTGKQISYSTGMDVGDFTMCIVSDGMGGLNNGDTASLNTVAWFKDFAEDILNSDNIPNALRSQVTEVSAYVKKSVGGGATLAGILVFRNTVYAFSTGDSKIFADCTDRKWDNHVHSVARTDSDGKTRYALAEYIGKEDPDCAIEVLENCRRIVLCSDGLMPIYSEIASDTDHTAEEFCRMALEKGSDDNVTAVVLRF